MESVTCDRSECDDTTSEQPTEASHTLLLDSSQLDKEIKFSSTPEFKDHYKNITIPKAGFSGMKCRIPPHLSKIGHSIQLSDFLHCVYCDVVVKRCNSERHKVSVSHTEKKLKYQKLSKQLNKNRHSKRNIQSSNSLTILPKRQKVVDDSVTRTRSEIQEVNVTLSKELLKDIGSLPTDSKKRVKDADTQTYSQRIQEDASTQTPSPTCNQAGDLCGGHQQYVTETTQNKELEQFQKNVIGHLFSLRNGFIDVVTRRHKAARSEYREALAKLNMNHKAEMEYYRQAVDDHVKDVEIVRDIVLNSQTVFKPPH